MTLTTLLLILKTLPERRDTWGSSRHSYERYNYNIINQTLFPVEEIITISELVRLLILILTFMVAVNTTSNNTTDPEGIIHNISNSVNTFIVLCILIIIWLSSFTLDFPLRIVIVKIPRSSHLCSHVTTITTWEFSA